MMQDRIHFPGLNGLRLLAALAVVVGHIELFKGYFGMTDRPEDVSFFIDKFFLNARDAVTLFFVLSGFLITYLLLAEQKATNTIAIKKFYVRRILRIWPLYYLILLISFIVIPIAYHITHFHGYYISPHSNFLMQFGLLVLFVPNIADLLNIYVLGAMQLWSVGIEEQFYLIWPVLLKKFAKHPLACLLGVITFKVFFIILNSIIRDTPFPPGIAFLYPVFIFIINFRIEDMAVGALGAYILFSNKELILKIIFHPILEKLALLFMILNIVIPHSNQFLRVGLVTDLELSVLYIVFILNVAANPHVTVKFDNRVFNSLGKLSYGIYMFHSAIIYLLLVAFSLAGFTDAANPLFNPLFYTVAIGLTLGISALSYHYFEMPFLRLKNRVTVIKSSDNVAADAPITGPSENTFSSTALGQKSPVPELK